MSYPSKSTIKHTVEFLQRGSLLEEQSNRDKCSQKNINLVIVGLLKNIKCRLVDVDNNLALTETPLCHILQIYFKSHMNYISWIFHNNAK